MALSWELIDGPVEQAVGRDMSSITERAKVPGGWLVRWYQYARDVKPIRGLERFAQWLNAADAEQPYAYKSGMAFVPDPMHEWDGHSLP